MRTTLFAAVLTFLAMTAAAPVADAKPIRLGISAKYLAAKPDNQGALDAVSPSLDRFLTSVRWRLVQDTCKDIRRGRFDWTNVDRAMELLDERGLTAVVALKSGPDCASKNNDERSEPKSEYLDEWAEFARRLAARYGPGGSYEVTPLRGIEIWSEQNLRSWVGPPSSYARYFVKVRKQILAGNRRVDAIVGGVGFCCKPERYLRELFQNNRIRKVADQVAVHSYSPDVATALKRLRAVRRVIPNRAEMLITEHGWSTCPSPDPTSPQGKCVDEERQAELLDEYVRALRKNARKLDLTDFFWFGAQDLATPESVEGCRSEPKDFYGFWTWGGESKPSLGVWEALTGTELPETIPENSELRTCRG